MPNRLHFFAVALVHWVRRSSFWPRCLVNSLKIHDLWIWLSPPSSPLLSMTANMVEISSRRFEPSSGLGAMLLALLRIFSFTATEFSTEYDASRCCSEFPYLTTSSDWPSSWLCT